MMGSVYLGLVVAVKEFSLYEHLFRKAERSIFDFISGTLLQ